MRSDVVALEPDPSMRATLSARVADDDLRIRVTVVGSAGPRHGSWLDRRARRRRAVAVSDYRGRVTEPVPPDQQRVSHADRDRVAEVLRDAAAEGRIDLDELEERLETTYAAKVYGDFVPLLADLPAEPPSGELVRPSPAQPAASRPAPGVVPAGVPTHATSVAVMSGQDRKGVWAVGSVHTATAIMGGITLDLREAIFAAGELVITANAIMGGVDVVVNERTRVVVDGIGIMGGFDQSRDKVAPVFDDASPVVRVRGVALMGGVTVTRKGPPKVRRPRLSKS